MDMNGTALTGLRVIDFSHVFQGPVGSQLLADYGADVIKIERPGGGDWSREWGPYIQGVSMPFAGLNRNKRCIALDLKSEVGKQITLRMIGTADVLMHNFRPAVMEKLGLGYEDLREVNPRLIYACSTGWGDRGPYVERRRSGHDMLARAAAGWFNSPVPGNPPAAIGISSDYPAGLMLVIGILMALQARERTGMGQMVTTDLFSVALHAHAWEAVEVLNRDKIDDWGGIGATEGAIEKIFQTQDGYIEVSPVFSVDALKDISLAMGLEDLSQDPRFLSPADRLSNRSKINDILAQRFAQKTTSEWVGILEPKGVLCTEVRSFCEAIEDPQTYANEMVIEMQHSKSGPVRMLGTPVRLHETKPFHLRFPPEIGEHTNEILIELGYSTDQIAAFGKSGALG
jgi:crotonobetainyl-CoA:carnitine CoA-transferase CaiB-like acyl-CoA transferase